MRKLLMCVALAFALAVAGGLAVACGDGEEAPSPSASPSTTESASPTPSPVATAAVPVLIYFSRGEYLGVAGREVQAQGSAEALAEAAMRELLAGPTAEEKEFGLGAVIPAGTRLNGVSILDGVATVDLSRAYESGGGSLSMLLRVAQVVFTLTQFDGVERVAFALDGVPAQAIGGEGIVVSPPVTRADFEGQAPAILVESPVPGQQVGNPVRVSGTANVFEAQFMVEVVDPEGLVVATRSVMATSGTGTRGTFTASIPFAVTRAGLGEIVFYEPSPKDGSRTNLVEIQVRMVQ